MPLARHMDQETGVQGKGSPCPRCHGEPVSELRPERWPLGSQPRVLDAMENAGVYKSAVDGSWALCPGSTPFQAPDHTASSDEEEGSPYSANLHGGEGDLVTFVGSSSSHLSQWGVLYPFHPLGTRSSAPRYWPGLRVTRACCSVAGLPQLSLPRRHGASLLPGLLGPQSHLRSEAIKLGSPDKWEEAQERPCRGGFGQLPREKGTLGLLRTCSHCADIKTASSCAKQMG